MMTCRMIQSQMADLLLESELDSELESKPASKQQPVPAEVREHAATCAECQAELAALRRTMELLDTWQAPEPSPYFNGRLQVRLREEQRAAPAGFLERLRARLLFGNALPVRQLTAGALAAVLAVAGGTIALEHQHQANAPAVQASATIRDLQSYDGNAQVFQQLSALDTDEDTGSAAN